MNLMKIKIAFLVCILSGLSARIMAQENTTNPKTQISIETDPSTFLFKGYAAHIRIKPKKSQRVLIGAGTYALDFPSFLVDMNEKNRNKGWNVRIQSAYSLFGEYYFKEANKKWFVGLQAGVQNFKLNMDNLGTSKYSNLLLMPSLGYNWKPFRSGFYLKPWMGVGLNHKISGTTSLQEKQYHTSVLVPFITLHTGYTF